MQPQPSAQSLVVVGRMQALEEEGMNEIYKHDTLMISFACVVGLILINGITRFAFNIEYPLLGITMYGYNPNDAYLIGSCFIVAICLVGQFLVCLNALSMEVE
jgi:hypothetical protein